MLRRVARVPLATSASSVGTVRSRSSTSVTSVPKSLYRLANSTPTAPLPRTMTDEQLQTFLAVFDRATPTGRRDYAMALCQVDLGLRVSEVAGLCLEDLDWRAATLRLPAGKIGRARELPLPQRVGQAIADSEAQIAAINTRLRDLDHGGGPHLRGMEQLR